jgi:hypothetical protein
MTKRSWKILILKDGLFGAAGHSPNHVALATRKVCQNDEILDRFAPLTSLWPSHISAKPKSMAMAYLAAFLAIEPWIVEFPLIWRMPLRIGAVAAVRHDELMGNLVDRFMAVTPHRKDRNLV